MPADDGAAVDRHPPLASAEFLGCLNIGSRIHSERTGMSGRRCGFGRLAGDDLREDERHVAEGRCSAAVCASDLCLGVLDFS